MQTVDEYPSVPMAFERGAAAALERSGFWRDPGLHWAYSLLPFIARRIACPERAQDVLHEALLRYAIRSGAPVEQPRAYLRKTIDAVLADQFRDAQRYRPLPDDEDAAKDTPTAPSALQVAELRERLLQVQRVLEVLPPRAREVFWLFRIEGCRQDEIAAQLGISRNMVERHVMRAMVALRLMQKHAAP